LRRAVLPLARSSSLQLRSRVYRGIKTSKPVADKKLIWLAL